MAKLICACDIHMTFLEVDHAKVNIMLFGCREMQEMQQLYKMKIKFEAIP
jgi:uncharacterized protein YhhL (DUF1145 family)